MSDARKAIHFCESDCLRDRHSHNFVQIVHVSTDNKRRDLTTGHEVINLFSCSTQLELKFILLKNVKMPTTAGILTFISRIDY